jgi:hypothetical protein
VSQAGQPDFGGHLSSQQNSSVNRGMETLTGTWQENGNQKHQQMWRLALRGSLVSGNSQEKELEGMSVKTFKSEK